MSSIRAFRFQLRLKPAQQRQLLRWAGGLRWVWNQALAEQLARHARGERYAGHAQMCKWLTAWRCDAQTAWLAEGPVHPQQQVLKRLDEAYKRFFEAAKAGKAAGRCGVKPPRFKRRGDEPGMRFPDAKQFELDQPNQRIKLPKLGWVRLRLSRPVIGELRNVSVRREGAAWLCSLQTRGADTLAAGLAPSLGIDLGLAQFAAMSCGQAVAPLKALAKQQCRLRRYQKSVSRKKKGSCNRRKAVARLGRLHARSARQRADWLHKLSTDLVERHPVIALEDLRVAAMSASARGTADRPGHRVRQKAGLNRGILDAAWAEFRRQLEYKTAAVGGEVIAVNPAYTSQRCAACGHTEAGNRKTQERFICLACGHADNADVNAAKNILAAGHAVWAKELAALPDACGGEVRRDRRASAGRAAPKKQEPFEETCRA
jgi:putative transposase